MKYKELCDSIIISTKSILDDAEELKLKESKIRAEAVLDFQKWLKDNVDIVGFDDKKNEILVGKNGIWVSAVDEYIKENKDE